MAYLKRVTKNILLLLAAEFDTDVSEHNKCKDIIEAIMGASDYDEETGKAFLDRITEEMAIAKSEREKEFERAEREREKEFERAEREREKEFERAERERERERNFELEKLRLMSNSAVNGMEYPMPVPMEKKVRLKDLVPKFDPKAIDITLFFLIFERQALKEKVDKNDWVSQLIPLLPTDIVEIIVKEPVEKADDYQYIKKLLLKRFKLTAVALKNKFEEHVRKPGALWTELVYELKGYMDNWLEAVGVTDFEALKELILLEQVKKRVPFQIKQQYMEIWDGFKTASDLAEKCDSYEMIRRNNRNEETKIWEKRNIGKDKAGTQWVRQREREKNHGGKPFGGGMEKSEEKGSHLTRGEGFRDSQAKNFNGQRKSRINCFACGGMGHYQYFCTQKKDQKPVGERKVSCIQAKVNLSSQIIGKRRDHDQLPLVNLNIAGRKVESVKDSGAEISVFRKDLIPDKFLTGGHIYLVPAIGEMQKAELITLPVGLWQDDQMISSEIDITAAVSEKLNCPALITPSVYDALLKQASIYSVTVGLGRPVLQEMTGREGRSELQLAGVGEQTQNSEAGPSDRQSLADVEEIEGGEDSLENGVDVAVKGKIIEYGTESKLFRKQQVECPMLKRLWDEGRKEKNCYFIEDGLLYRKSVILNERVKQLVVPECRRIEILRLAHNHDTAGHLAAEKTLERIKLSFFWEGLRKRVRQYCEACEDCQLRRRVRVSDRAPIRPVARPELPFQVVNADLIGPIEPSSSRGHKFVLTVVDQHSRWPEAIPIRSLTAKAACQAFLEIFTRMGVPQIIAMDNAKNFSAELTAEFLKHLTVVPRFSTPGYPLSNGLVERFNGSLKNMLHHAIRKHGKNWDRVLPLLLWAMREVPNQTTGVSPFQLMFGRTPNGPLSIMKTSWEGETVIPEGIGNNLTEYLEKLKNNLKFAADFASEISEKKQSDYANRYNLRSSTRKFSVGDKVIVLIPDSTNKLYSRWRGPGVIVDQKNEHSFLVELPDGSVRHLHQNKLRPYVQVVNTIGLVYEIDEEFGDVQHAPGRDTQDRKDAFEINIKEKLNHVGERERRQLEGILRKYKEVFSGEVKRAKVGSHAIRLKPEVERKQPHIYRVPEVLKATVEDQIEELLEKGLIEPSQAEIAYPLVCVAKKDASIRLCVDYKSLNVASKTTPFPMQDATELRYKAGSANYITTLDMLKGYWTIPMEKESKELTSFISPKGQYQWTVMPYGLNGSAVTFQKTMNVVLSKHRDYADSYIDDIIIYSKTWEEHLKHLDAVLGTLQDFNFSANIKKCCFVQEKVTYLGHVVGAGEHGPDPEKLKAIENLQRPKDKKQLRSVLGLFNYYREYVQNFAEIAIPLTALTKKNIPNEIPWSEKEEAAFACLKEKLCQAVALNTPDMKKPFVISCDASQVGVGASLCQLNERNKLMPISFASQKLTETQRRWSTIEREAYALIWSLRKFETWIFGAKVYVYTDHNPLKYLTESAPRNAKLQRWLLAVQRYNIEINYKPGASNKDADALSRLVTI